MNLKNKLKKLGVVLSLLVGSTSLQAQSSDPFGDVNEHKYKGNMTITAQVVQNGNVVTDAVVAVYCESELRGKGGVGNDPYNPNLVYLTVYGISGNSLYFKVYTNGSVFTFNPDPAIYWENNDIIGSTSTPYIITLPVSLADNADNSSVLTTYDGQTCDIVLTDRTLYKDGAWNTLCLPFDVSTSNSPLAGDGVQAMTLNTTTSRLNGSTLTLNFKPATDIPAGTPFIIKWTAGDNISNPVFQGVTVSTASNNATVTGVLTFTGTYAPVSIGAAGDNTKLYLGDGNTLYYPNAAMTIGCQRAYFQLADGITAGTPSPLTIVLNFEDDTPNGITTLAPTRITVEEPWYDLSGRKVSLTPDPGLTPDPSPKGEGRLGEGRKLPRGIYIHNGRKVVIK